MDGKTLDAITERLNKYADQVLKGKDLQKMQISEQLDYLKPEMNKLAAEYGVDTTDIFIGYMDSTAAMVNNVPKAIDNFDVDESIEEEFQEYMNKKFSQ